MAAVLIPDRIEQSIVEDSCRLLRIARLFIVTGVTDSLNQNNVAAFSVAGLPALYDLHPTPGVGAIVRNRNLVPLGSQVFKIICMYELERIPRIINTSTVLTQIQTFYDKDGNPTSVAYTPTGSSAPAQPYSVGLIRSVPLTTVRFEYIMASSTESLGIAATGLVNSTGWRGQAARTWQASSIESVTRDFFFWNAIFSFVYNPQSWDSYGVYRDKFGAVPTDVDPIDFTGPTSGNGWARFQLYNPQDFGTVFPFIT